MGNPKELVIKPGDPMTVKQAEDLHRRTGWPVLYDSCTGQVIVFPRDQHDPTTDIFDVSEDYSPPAIDNQN